MFLIGIQSKKRVALENFGFVRSCRVKSTTVQGISGPHSDDPCPRTVYIWAWINKDNGGFIVLHRIAELYGGNLGSDFGLLFFFCCIV